MSGDRAGGAEQGSVLADGGTGGRGAISGSGSRLPLTAAQSGMWFAQQLDPSNPIYQAGEYVEIDGPLDADLLETAIRRASEATEATRVHVEVDDTGAVWQVLGMCDGWVCDRVDVSDATDPEREALTWMDAQMRRPMDLSRAPLFRAAILRLADDRHMFYASAHHIAMDGYAFSLLIARIAQNYTALDNGGECDSDVLGSLTEFLADERRYRSSEKFALDREYWHGHLRDQGEPVTLSGRRVGTSRTFLRSSGFVAPVVTGRLRTWARECRSSLPAVLMAAWGIYVGRFTGATEVTVGLPVTARSGALARATPGMLAAILPLRLRAQSTRVSDSKRNARRTRTSQCNPDADMRWATVW